MMVRRSLLLFTLVLTSHLLAAQDFRLAGRVRQKNKEPLPGATVYIEEIQRGTNTDGNGNYSIMLPAGYYTLRISFIGFQTKTQRINLSSSQFVNVVLDEQAKELGEVVVSGQAKDYNVKGLEMGVNKLEMRELQKLPAFMGEVDVMKSLLFLPGVTTVGEGTSNINVRGGNSDQNLILLDDAPIFNPSHLMGLLSVFNPDMTRNITLYRGAISPAFGGRASSILDIGLRGPSESKISVQGGIGLIASRLLVEGPVIKDKLSFIVGGRFSDPTYLFPLANSPALTNTKANFYDITSRLEYVPDQKNKIYLTGYISNDNFKPSGDSLAANTLNGTTANYHWRTGNLTLGWIHSFNDRLSLKTSAVLSQYSSDIDSPEQLTAYNLNSTVNYKSIKSDLSYQTVKHKLQFGMEGIHYAIQPGTLTPESDISSVVPVTLAQEQSVELAGFALDEFQLNSKISFMFGLRYSYYLSLGPADVYNYDPNLPKSIETIIDTTHYNAGQVVKTYGGVEPRASVRFEVSPKSSVKLGYSRLRQYIQRITNTTSALPTDRWQTSNTYIRPLVSDQVSVGYFRNFYDNMFEASVEVYAKEMTDISDYKDGSNLLLNPATERYFRVKEKQRVWNFR